MPPKQLVLDDPQYVPRQRYNAFDRWALRLLNDPRDLPFVHLCLQITCLILPFAVLLFVPGVFRWWLGGLYLFLTLGMYLDRFILMLHNTSHRPFFRRDYKRLNLLIPWVYGPLFGESPNTYYAHHVGMHHPENNLSTDLSSTMHYQRDSIRAFARYFFRFFFGIIFELTLYMVRTRRYGLLRRMLIGEFTFFAVTAMLLWVNWRAALVVLVIPFIFTRFMMMAGNWGQHAFVDREDPGNCYRNSITCINCRYNRRAFNDGYHIGHHVRANRHWTEMPSDLLQNQSRYAEERAIVFEGIDFFGVWAMLMLKRYDRLARRVVPLGERTPSEAEIIALLKERTQAIPKSTPQRVEFAANLY